MAYNPADYVKYSSKLNFEQKIMHEIKREAASTMGRYGKRIDESVKVQKVILDELKELIEVNERFEINEDQLNCLEKALLVKVNKLVKKYNDKQADAELYQYYLNVQKECLNLKVFNRNPYGILPKLKIVN